MGECNENDFWSWLEGPWEDNADEDTNKLLSLIGIITGHVAVLTMIIGAFWPLFGIGAISAFASLFGVKIGLPWYYYIFIALGFISLAFQVWGLITWIGADGDRNEATVFRAWRTNFLAQATHAILEFLVFATWLIITLINNALLASWLSFAFFVSAFVLGGVALYLTFFAKGWWINVDDMRMMRCDEEWNLFGNDADWEPWWTEEEDDAVEEIIETTEETTEEEW